MILRYISTLVIFNSYTCMEETKIAYFLSWLKFKGALSRGFIPVFTLVLCVLKSLLSTFTPTQNAPVELY